MNKKSLIALSAMVILAVVSVFTVVLVNGNMSGDVYKLESIMGMDLEWFGYDEDMMTVTLYPGGKTRIELDGEISEDATWKQSGKNITISAYGEQIRGTLSDGTLTLNIDGADAVLKKQ